MRDCKNKQGAYLFVMCIFFYSPVISVGVGGVMGSVEGARVV